MDEVKDINNNAPVGQQNIGDHNTNIQVNVSISNPTDSSALSRFDQYQQWEMDYIAKLLIPVISLKIVIPIEDAWLELRTSMRKSDVLSLSNLGLQFTKYNGWEDSVHQNNTYNAEDVARIGHRVMIVGGPGSGKSTLCQKLAHDLPTFGELALRVHLREVIKRTSQGMNINDAIIEVATNGFSHSLPSSSVLYKDLNCLIADGLDECHDLSKAIEDMLSWAAAHPNIRIIITTRPNGYVSEYFKDWECHELLSLSKDQVPGYAKKIIAAISENTARSEEHFQSFQSQLKSDVTASLAARNPLLLIFIILHSRASVSPVKYRAELYEQIIELWCDVQQNDRHPFKPESMILDSLSIIGWTIQNAGKLEERLHKKIVQKLTEHFVQELNCKKPTAKDKALNCLSFWQEKGILESLQDGSEKIYTFVHNTLGEYAAAQYLVSLDSSQIQEHVLEKWNNSHWEEVLLIAAGLGKANTIVETLLTIATTDTNIEIPALLFAAKALAETDDYSPDLAEKIAGQLKTFLSSPILATTYEVVKQVRAFATQASSTMAPILQPLFTHHQRWTRFAAIDLVLMGNPELVQIEILEPLLREIVINPIKDKRKDKSNYETTREMLLDFDDGWVLQNDIVRRGAKRMAHIRMDDTTKKLLQDLYLIPDNSANTCYKLSDLLKDLSCEDFLEQHPRLPNIFPGFFKIGHEADQKMLETILRVTKLSASLQPKQRKLTALVHLIHALRVPESGITQWDILSQLNDMESIEAVLLGFIQVYKIDQAELALDAAWALQRIQEIPPPDGVNISLLNLLPDIPVKLDLPQKVDINIPVQDLLRALTHPSAIIGYGAGWLLVVAANKEDLEASFQKMKQEINSSKQAKEIIAKIIPFLWEEGVPSWLGHFFTEATE